MSSVRFGRPSPGTAIAVLALCISLVGTGYAMPGRNGIDGNDLRRGVVKTKNIRKKAVKTFKIAPNAVKTGRIANGTISAADIGAGAVGQSEIATDAVGAAELKTVLTTGSGQQVLAGQPGQATATCTGDRQIVSGGFRWDIDAAGLAATSMELNTNNDSVTVRAFNGSGANRTLSARAYCVAE